MKKIIRLCIELGSLNIFIELFEVCPTLSRKERLRKKNGYVDDFYRVW